MALYHKICRGYCSGSCVKWKAKGKLANKACVWNSPIKPILTKNREPLHTPLSWTLARYRARSNPQSNLLKHMFHSLKLANSEVWPPRDVGGANVNEEACKTHITRVLKQCTLLEDETINWSW